MIAVRDLLLREASTSRTVPAELFRDLTASEVALADSHWLLFLASALQMRLAQGVSPADLPEHKHWRWIRKANVYAAKPGYSFHSVVCAGETQGLALFNTTRLSRLSATPSHIVYVDYVATAPWNLAALADAPRYKGVGCVLIEAAVAHSHAAGYAGRLGLHALPQSEAFYRDTCGMTDCGADAAESGLFYFEMTAA